MIPRDALEAAERGASEVGVDINLVSSSRCVDPPRDWSSHVVRHSALLARDTALRLWAARAKRGTRRYTECTDREARTVERGSSEAPHANGH